MRNSKKFISVILAVLMAISMMPLTAFATDYEGGSFIDVQEDLQIGDKIYLDNSTNMHHFEGDVVLQAGQFLEFPDMWACEDRNKGNGTVTSSNISMSIDDIKMGEYYFSFVQDRSKEEVYVPIDENGNTVNYIVVLEKGEDWEDPIIFGTHAVTVTYNATFSDSLISDSSVDSVALDSDCFGSVDTVNANTAYEFTKNGNEVIFSVLLKTQNFNPDNLTVKVGENTLPVYTGLLEKYDCVNYDSLVDSNGDIYGYRYRISWSNVNEDISIAYTPTAAGSYLDLKNTATVIHFNDMEWYLIADNSTTETQGSVTLLAKECVTSASDSSDINALLNAMTASGGDFENVADLILSVGSGTKLYLPGLRELATVSPRLLKCSKESGAQKNMWWLGSLEYGRRQAVNGDDGAIWLMPSSGWTYGIRPALKLDLSKVEFDSATNTFAPAADYVAEVNGVGYETLEGAIAAANTGDTVTLLKDIDFRESYPWGTAHYIDISGITLDLDGHRIDVQNFGVIWTGKNFTIKNGTFVGEKRTSTSYGLHVYGKDNTTDNLGDLPQAADVPVQNAVLEDLTIVGGANIWYAENVVLKNCQVTGQNYYAVWANYGSDVTIESGTYTSDCVKTNGVLGAQNNAEAGGSLKVTGGDVTVPANKNLVYKSSGDVAISGGTYNVVVPQKYCANGYIPVTEPNAQGKYTVKQAEVAANFTLDGSVNFNLYLDKDYPADYTVDLTYNHASNVSETAAYATDSVTLADLDVYSGPESDYQGYYTFSIKQAPAQIGDDITIVIKNTNGTTVYSNTVQTSTLCKERAAATDGNLKALYEAIVDYGKASQAYFGGSAVADSYYNDEVTTLTTIPTTGGSATLAVTGVSLVVTSELGINIYTSDLVTVNSVSTAGDSAITAEAGYGDTTDTPVIVVRGIAASDLGDNFTVSTSGGDITMSAYTVARSILAGSTDTNYQNLARAMYLYGEAAAAYFA